MERFSKMFPFILNLLYTQEHVIFTLQSVLYQ